jgi:hypothetical protein
MDDNVCPTVASFLFPECRRPCHRARRTAVKSITTFAGSLNGFSGTDKAASAGGNGGIAALDVGRYAGFKGEGGDGMPRKPAAAEAEAEARAINAKPWEPMPDMVKRKCPRCRYFFASPVGSAERRCADCVSVGTGAPRTRAVA